MLTVAEALRAIADSMPAFDTETVELDNAADRILRQTVTAERDQPPFDRVTMDGIAINHASFIAGARSFGIQGTQHAGDPVHSLDGLDRCIEIMTGAVLPSGTDCVIPVERISVIEGTATLEDGYEPEANQFIHPRGSDYEKGFEVLRPGVPISPLEIAIIASCGLTRIEVSRQPSIRVISTGNELVPPGHSIEPHQVRLSNGPALVSMLNRHGYGDASHEHLVDDPAILRDRLSAILREAGVLVLSGGVSMGKADFVPEVLRDLGVEVVFHKISQRPGKPMWYGLGTEGQAVFALPGNPVSAMVCCRHYVLPALRAAAGDATQNTGNAVLAEDVTFRPALTCFMPVRLAAGDDGSVNATPVPTNTSGDFASLAGTDGYVELERDETEFSAGIVVPLHPWDRL